MRLHPNRPIVNYRYYKSEMHVIHLICWHHHLAYLFSTECMFLSTASWSGDIVKRHHGKLGTICISYDSHFQDSNNCLISPHKSMSACLNLFQPFFSLSGLYFVVSVALSFKLTDFFVVSNLLLISFRNFFFRSYLGFFFIAYIFFTFMFSFKHLKYLE